MSEMMLTLEQWRKKHPRLHGTKYNTYMKKWKEAHKEKKPPLADMPTCSAYQVENWPPVEVYSKKIEVEKMGIIESAQGVLGGQQVQPMGKIDKELMSANSRRDILRAKAANLSARIDGVQDGVVGADVFMEMGALCAELLSENKKVLKLAEAVYLTAKHDMTANQSAGEKYKTGSKSVSKALKEAADE